MKRARRSGPTTRLSERRSIAKSSTGRSVESLRASCPLRRNVGFAILAWLFVFLKKTRESSMSRRKFLIAVCTLLLACHAEKFPGMGETSTPPTGPASGTSGPASPATAAAAVTVTAPGQKMPTTGDYKLGAHPRILLNAERLKGLEEMAKLNPPRWQTLVKNCDECTNKSCTSGYQGEDWGHVALDLAICGKVLKKPAYTKASLKYMQALVDDHDSVGDKKGGDKVAQDDTGYAIRNRGFLAAVAYDWLHDEPEMTAAIKKHMIGRFYAFNTWYKKDGYRTSEPWSNHFLGWFGAAMAAGIATEGDDPKGAEMRKMAKDLWDKIIVPKYKTSLEGGDYPEGWQYARLIGAILGMYIEAEGRAYPGGPEKMADDLPWLRQSVAFQTHAMMPDGTHTYDSGDWGKKPSVPYAYQNYGVAVALPPGDTFGKQALHMARQNKHATEPGWNWLIAIVDQPTRQSEDPKKGPTSHFAKGTGVVLARTDWSEYASWVSFNSGPFFGDHQHLDQGHFEIAHGEDALLVDPGDYGSYSTMSHNCILVEDKKENNRWSPNQSIYSKDAAMVRFEDVGGIVYAQADYTTAWNPDDYPHYKKTRSVARAERDFIFSRNPMTGMPGAGNSRVVVYDRFTTTKPTYEVTWAGHGGSKPEVSGAELKITVGRSMATVTTLLPAGATAKLVAEPTVKSGEVYLKNDVAEGMTSTRFEIAGAKGKTEHRFLHTFAVGMGGQKAPPATRIDGVGMEGAAIESEAYLFPSGAPQRVAAAVSYAAPTTATRHVVTGLAPGQKYAARAAMESGLCKVSLSPGGTMTASSAGVATLTVNTCVVK